MKLTHSWKIMMLIILSITFVSCTQGGQNPTIAVDVAATLNAVQVESANALHTLQTQSADSLDDVKKQAAESLVAAQTEIAATLSAQYMQAASAIPTSTPYQAPEMTATPIPTAVEPMPTAVPPVVQPVVVATRIPAAYSCRVISQSPDANPVVTPGYDFDTTWVIKNTGTKIWNQGEIDFRYSSGTKFQKYADGFDLPENVDPGEEIELTVDMTAPLEKGYYFATWVVIRGNSPVCYLTTEITVK